MKSKFSYYYPPSADREEEIRTKGLFVIDTNVLLDILRLGKDLAEKAIIALSDNKDRIRIPFYVAWEYHKHFRHVVYDQVQNLEKVRNTITVDQVFSHVLNLLDNVRLPKSDKENLKQAFEEPTNKLIQKIQDLYTYYKGISQGLVLQERIALTLDNAVMTEIDETSLRQREAEAQKRYAAKIPPGYKDVKKRDNQYGDYIIWTEILTLAKEENCDVIFVSRDLKEDWQVINNGQRLCPRYELQKEFQSVAPERFFRATTLDGFLEMLDNDFSDVEIAEVKAIANDRNWIRSKPTVQIISEDLDSMEALFGEMDEFNNLKYQSSEEFVDKELLSTNKKDSQGE